MEVDVSGGQEAPEAAAAPETNGGAGGIDLGPVLEHVEKLGTSLGERLDGFEQRLPQPEQPQDPFTRNDLGQFAGQPPQQQYGQQPGVPAQQPGMYDEYGELTPEGAHAQLQQMLGPMLTPMQQQMQQMAAQNAQLSETIESFQVDRGAEQLETEFPELKEDAAAQELVSYVAETMGRPDLVGDVRIMRAAHLARRAERAAENETPATPSPTLEPAGGASLAGTEPTIQDRIKNAGGVQNSVWRV